MNDFILFSAWGSDGESSSHSSEHKINSVQYFHDKNTMNGAEFLDDTLRMTSQPLTVDGF